MTIKNLVYERDTNSEIDLIADALEVVVERRLAIRCKGVPPAALQMILPRRARIGRERTRQDSLRRRARLRRLLGLWQRGNHGVFTACLVGG